MVTVNERNQQSPVELVFDCPGPGGKQGVTIGLPDLESFRMMLRGLADALRSVDTEIGEQRDEFDFQFKITPLGVSASLRPKGGWPGPTPGRGAPN